MNSANAIRLRWVGPCEYSVYGELFFFWPRAKFVENNIKRIPQIPIESLKTESEFNMRIVVERVHYFLVDFLCLLFCFSCYDPSKSIRCRLGHLPIFNFKGIAPYHPMHYISFHLHPRPIFFFPLSYFIVRYI